MTGVRQGARSHVTAVAGSTVLLLVALLAWTTPGAFGGYSARITNSVDTAGTAAAFTCTDADLLDKATAVFQWPLTDLGATASDLSGTGRTGMHVGGTVTDPGPSAACLRDTGPSWSLDGSTQYAYLPALQPVAPTTFTLEVWFRTSTAQGKLIGFGSSQTGSSLGFDRQLYITSSGALAFGVFSGANRTVISTAAVTDDVWHQAVATLSPSTGMVLYLDGAPVGSDPTTTTAQTYLAGGYWRVGYDNLTSWPGVPLLASSFFKGRMRFAAVYTSALTASQVAVHYRAGT